MGRIVLVTGGARSGKSTYAEKRAAGAAVEVVYLATMQPAEDAELALRVRAHRARRPASWRTLEEPLELADELRRLPGASLVLLDCLTLWVSNLLFRAVPSVESATPRDWQAAIDECVRLAGELCDLQRTREGDLIAVTNEVGMGIVPADPLSRAFRDAAGLVNQCFAADADEVVLMVSGRPLVL